MSSRTPQVRHPRLIGHHQPEDLAWATGMNSTQGQRGTRTGSTRWGAFVVWSAITLVSTPFHPEHQRSLILVLIGRTSAGSPAGLMLVVGEAFATASWPTTPASACGWPTSSIDDDSRPDKRWRPRSTGSTRTAGRAATPHLGRLRIANGWPEVAAAPPPNLRSGPGSRRAWHRRGWRVPPAQAPPTARNLAVVPP